MTTQLDNDPDNERDWYDLALGFFLGRGASIDQAHALAEEVNSQDFINEMKEKDEG